MPEINMRGIPINGDSWKCFNDENSGYFEPPRFRPSGSLNSNLFGGLFLIFFIFFIAMIPMAFLYLVFSSSMVLPDKVVFGNIHLFLIFYIIFAFVGIVAMSACMGGNNASSI